MAAYHYHAKSQSLYVENVSLETIAQRFGTPCYVMSRTTLKQNWLAFDQALEQQSHLICYAVKANSNLSVLNTLAEMGSGFDVVSIGELERVLAAGGNPQKVVFSGVGKQAHEIERALKAGIFCINIESLPELDLVNQIAKKLHLQAPISIRVNPDIDAQTHPYISTGLHENKFGIDYDQALEAYLTAAHYPNIIIKGVDCHIGSQIVTLDPFIETLGAIKTLIERLEQHDIFIEHLNLGGGLGVRYQNENPPSPQAYAQAIINKLNNTNLTLILEPGRAIAADAGLLLTQVLFLKKTPKKNFAIVDAAMNDLIRPALYQSWHDILPVKKSNLGENNDGNPTCYDIVGPICESSDFLAKERHLHLTTSDLLAVTDTGAYASSMASNYNTRPRAAEVMVEDSRAWLIRPREEVEQLFQDEQSALHNQ